MADIDDPNSVISEIRPDSYKTLLADGVVNKGMIPKIDGAFKALNSGVKVVTIKHSEALTNAASGTKILL